MTAEQFRTYWNKTYPDSYPIDFEFKTIFNNRWFRIHSLPDSKRYAENDVEYKIILSRQNRLISDLFQSDDFFIVIGFYNYDLSSPLTDDYFDLDKFQKIDTLALHKIRPEEYQEDEVFYDIYMKPDKWESDKFNDLLTKIADDEIRAMFVNSTKNITVVPYDGGMDIILPDTKTRDDFRIKYKDWLSSREDGL
jgi:hypothetical protein